MKRMLFLGILISFLISGNAAAMGPAIGLIMKGAGIMGGEMTSGHGKQHDSTQGGIKSGQGDTDGQKITDDKKDDDGLVGCHSGTTQDYQNEDGKPTDRTERK
ncbi:MAG: hypothetical protein M1147_02455 [Nitrospirae bacterium]|nr:hypothetical protein [Nitrospirota bacterium]MCL5976975.1 hypothetical protein [Nitrospirota bacterium]